MSEKQKIPLVKKTGKPMAAEQNRTGKRGIEPEETHRHVGSRAPEQGGGKSKGTKR